MENSPIGIVYFLYGDGLTKIGRSSHDAFKKRMSRLQNNSPSALTLMFWFWTDESKEIEGEYHDMFWRERKHGEWFDLSKDDVDNILVDWDTKSEGDLLTSYLFEGTRCMEGKRSPDNGTTTNHLR